MPTRQPSSSLQTYADYEIYSWRELLADSLHCCTASLDIFAVADRIVPVRNGRVVHADKLDVVLLYFDVDELCRLVKEELKERHCTTGKQ